MLSLSFIFASQSIAEPVYKSISTGQLKMMMDKKEAFVLVDARTNEEYDEAHIPAP